ncbi:MAG: 30S ribosomal protein S16 [Minisyncoccia bacterium]
MLKIRLQRTGRTNDPSYRVVVTEHTNGPKSGRAVETVGSYNPKSKERKLDADRIKYWISMGAQASGTMHNMLISTGITKGKKINVLPQKSPPKKEGEEVAAAPVAPTAAPVAETPAPEEAPAEAPAEEVTEAAPEETPAPAQA